MQVWCLYLRISFIVITGILDEAITFAGVSCFKFEFLCNNWKYYHVVQGFNNYWEYYDPYYVRKYKVDSTCHTRHYLLFATIFRACNDFPLHTVILYWQPWQRTFILFRCHCYCFSFVQFVLAEIIKAFWNSSWLLAFHLIE